MSKIYEQLQPVVSALDNRISNVDGQVGELKSDLGIEKTKNIYDQSLLMVGYRINANGELGGGGAATSVVTGYIDVHGLENVTIGLEGFSSNAVSYYCFYPEDKSFATFPRQSGFTAPHTIAVPDNAYYLMFQIPTSNYTEGTSKIMVQSGTVYTGYEEYGNKFVLADDVESIKEKVGSIEKELYTGNVFDFSGIMEGYTINASGELGGGGNNPTYDFSGYVDISGFENVTISLLDFIATGVSSWYCFYNANKSPVGTRQSNFPTTGIDNVGYKSVPAGAKYIGFTMAKSNRTYKERIVVQSGTEFAGYIKNTVVGSIKDLYSADKSKRSGVYVAASDSTDRDKENADIVCSGVGDEIKIQQAIDSVGNNGTVHLYAGTYYIDGFHKNSVGIYNALTIPCASYNRIKLKCDSIPNRSNGFTGISNCAVLVVSESCYSSLDDNTEYSVIGCDSNSATMSKFRYNMHICEGIGIKLPDNQKNIICFDGKLASAIEWKRCMANAVKDEANLTVGANKCIGFRVTNGSNFGINDIIGECAAYGFNVGFELGAEHYIVYDCKTIYNNYGYIFNNVNAQSAVGSYVHPNTLINCCSEMDFNYPYFGYNVSNQPITMIDFNVEHKNAQMALGGDLAKELVPGSWRGTINYTIKTYSTDGYPISGNNVSMPFWESGHGTNVKSCNDAQKQICTKTERESYAANQMQRVFDTIENKFYTYVNNGWINA